MDVNAEPDPMSLWLAFLGDRDTGWKKQGLCRNADSERRFWFTCLETDVVMVAGMEVSGADAQAAAVKVCSMCPVQWQCCSYAIDVEEPIGVWGASTRDRRWLVANTADPLGIVEFAREVVMPVTVAIRHIRDSFSSVPLITPPVASVA